MSISSTAPDLFANLRDMERSALRFVLNGEGSFDELIFQAHFVQRSLCAVYDTYCRSFGEARSWREIPALPLSAFRRASIRSFPDEQTVQTFRTSGTTGEGYGEHHFRILELYRAAALGGWKFAGLPTETPFCLMPSPREAPFSSLSCMAGWMAPAERFFLGNWDHLVRTLLRTESKVVIFGTALAFLNVFEWLGDRQIPLPPGSVAIETGGFKGTKRMLQKSELYARFQKYLGLSEEDVWNEYGMTELSSQFYSRGLANPHRAAPWVRARVINPESGEECAEGETGTLRIFDLANIGSCCALQTRDLAIRRGEEFVLIGRDPSALPRGCSRPIEEMLAG
jgi:hypothetical protein